MERLVELREKAERCRRLAQFIDDERTLQVLREMADECDAKAGKLATPDPEDAAS